MSDAPKTYTLLGADGRPYQSSTKGRWGGHRGSKIYGRLDCRTALKAVARGSYVKHRVFFPDEATAVAAGFRPCGTCCTHRYQRWKAAREDSAAREEVSVTLRDLRTGEWP
ncbi:Ada metal-binding domain-containing protein [Cryptosporangium sp. NPDC048952]|uniref:Ada metal-binding domain-containing protein n=1 Tax=Cryptosporangium sp. NPDC048952 TaxID=3363961 RepID=UPI0037200652